MNIICYEWKKIWNLKATIIFVLLCILFYGIFMRSHLDPLYPGGHPETETIAIAAMLTQKYGPTLEQEELDEFVQENRDKWIRSADSDITDSASMAELGISSYGELRESIEVLSSASASEEDRVKLIEIMTEYWNLFGENSLPHPAYMIFALDDIVKSFELVSDPSLIINNLAGEDSGSRYHRERFQAISGSNEYSGILPLRLLENTIGYGRDLAVLVVLSTLIMFAPLVVTDRLRRVHLLQYSAKQGRRIISGQLTTVLLSSVLLTTLLVLVFGMIYAANDPQFFWNNDVSSFLSAYHLTIRLTFGQYIMIMVGMIYLLGIAAASVAFLVSRFSGSYIVMIAGMILNLIAGIVFIREIVLTAPLNDLAFKTGIAFYEPILCILINGICIVFLLCMAYRERKIDIL